MTATTQDAAGTHAATAGELKGMTLEPVRFPVEAGKIAELSRAVGRTPHGEVPADWRGADGGQWEAPLTFSVVSRLYGSGDATSVVTDLGLDPGRVVHGEQEWIYHSAPRVGQVLTGVPTVADAYAKPGRQGDMLFVLLETVLTDEATGEPVVTERMLTIQLPAVDHKATPVDTATVVPADPERLRVDADGPTLLGSRCPGCGESYFPRRWECPVDLVPVEDVDLSRSGTIHTATYVAKPAYGTAQLDAQGYGVGQVDLPEGVRLQCILVGEQEDWVPGAAVQLLTEPVGEDAEGHQRVVHRFGVRR